MPRGTTVGKYRSKFEQTIAEQLSSAGVKHLYEDKEHKIEYTVPSSLHRYLPDFVIFKRDGTPIYIESKGIWDSKDRLKHLLIRQQSPELDIRFIFYRATQRIRKRSKVTYIDICEGLGRAPFKGVKWKWSEGRIPGEWFDE